MWSNYFWTAAGVASINEGVVLGREVGLFGVVLKNMINLLQMSFWTVWTVGTWHFWKKSEMKLFLRFSLIGVGNVLILSWIIIVENILQLPNETLLLNLKVVQLLNIGLSVLIPLVFAYSYFHKYWK